MDPGFGTGTLSTSYGPLGLKSDQTLGSRAMPKLSPNVCDDTVGTVVNGSWLAAEDGQVAMLVQGISPGASLLVAPHTPSTRMLIPGFGSSDGPNTAVPSEVIELPPTMFGISHRDF